jgi:tetratricopeptide (TPR) repeat protein
MLEHLHPNIDGYFIIADAFFEALARASLANTLVHASRDSARAEVPVTAIDSIAGLLHADRLTSGWPFQPRGITRTPRVDTMKATTVPEQLAKDMVLGTIAWPEATERLRTEYEKGGNVDKAIHAALVMAQEYRYSAQPYLDAARISVGAHRTEDALRFTLAALAREETARTSELAGLLLLRTGDNARALRYLRRAAELSPTDRRIATTFQAAEALPRLEERRRMAPRDTTALFNLALAYAVTQQNEKATAVAKTLLKVAPTHARARQLLLRIPADGS